MGRKPIDESLKGKATYYRKDVRSIWYAAIKKKIAINNGLFSICKEWDTYEGFIKDLDYLPRPEGMENKELWPCIVFPYSEFNKDNVVLVHREDNKRLPKTRVKEGVTTTYDNVLVPKVLDNKYKIIRIYIASDKKLYGNNYRDEKPRSFYLKEYFNLLKKHSFPNIRGMSEVIEKICKRGLEEIYKQDPFVVIVDGKTTLQECLDVKK